MATIVANASGGTRAWSDTATWTGGVVPSPTTDVQLSAGSGPVTIDAGAVCRSLDCTGYTNTLTHNAVVSLTIGDATAGLGNIALKLVSGMTYTLGSATTSGFIFASTSATVQTIATGTKATGNVTFSGVSGSWQLADNWTSTSITVTHTDGTLDFNGKTVAWTSFVSSSGSTRTLTLGAASITLTFSGAAWNSSTSTGLTVTANTATVTLNASGSTQFTGGTANYNGLSVVISGNAFSTFTGSCTVANLTKTTTAVKGSTLIFSNSPTITGTLTVTGNSAINRISVESSVIGSLRTVTVGTGFSFTNVDFQDIAATGAAGTWTGTSMGDSLGNSGITFDASVTQTHTTSAGGSWSDASKWTSRVPLPQDNVVINASTTGTITADMPRLGADITFAGFVGTADFSSVDNMMFGGLILGSGMTISGTRNIYLAARSSKTITSNGKQFSQPVNLYAPSGTYTLADALSTAGTFIVYIGTFATSTFGVTCTTFNMSGASSTVTSSGTWTLTSTAAGAIWTKTTGTFTSAASVIVISAASANSRTFAGGGATYGTLTYTVAGSTGALVITGANTFATLNFSDVTNARTLTFPAGTTNTFTTLFNVNGTAAKLMTINSSSPGTKATLSKASGVVTCDYLSLFDSAAAGGASWLAGANSIDN